MGIQYRNTSTSSVELFRFQKFRDHLASLLVFFTDDEILEYEKANYFNVCAGIDFGL